MHSDDLSNMLEEPKKPMKITILVRQFPNIVQTYILNHIIALKHLGADTTIIAASNPKQAEVHPAVNKYKLMSEVIYINTVRYGVLRQVFTFPLYLSTLNKALFSSLWTTYGIKYGIKAVLTAKSLPIHNCDVIHSHTLISSYEYLYLKDIFHIPIITTFHGFEPKSSKPLAAKKMRAVFKKADAFIVNTHFAQTQLTDLGCPQNKIHIIPQGTNTVDFPYKSRQLSKEQPIIILSVGRLSIEKGFHIAIKAIAETVKHFPDIKYHIIGSGPEEADLTALIHSLGLQETVKIFGAVSTDELLNHYSTAHMFVLPSIDFRDGSHTETQGVVLQEAQSSGIPVLASRTGGIPEIIKDGRTGLLFDEEDDAQLAQLIESLITDNNLYQNLSLQARKDVEENYSIDVIGARLLNVYKNALSKTDKN